MKYLLIIVLLLLSVYSQSQDTLQNQTLSIIEHRSIRKTMNLSSRLELSNAESQRLLAVILSYSQQRKAVRENSENQADKTKLKEQLEQINRQEIKAIAAALPAAKRRLYKWRQTKAKWRPYYRKIKPYLPIGMVLFVALFAGLGIWRWRSV